MENEQTFDLENIISDVFKETRIKISKDDPVFSIMVMHEKILESILLKIKESNVLVTDCIKEKLSADLSLISTEIAKLPDAIDSKTSDLRNAAVDLHDEFQQSKGEVKGAFEEARLNATKQLSESVMMTAAKVSEVIDSANSAIKNINEHTESVINSTLKKSLDNYEGKTNDITKKLDNAIRNAFEKSTKKFMTVCAVALFFSTVMQLGMWGWFVYMLSR
ncbi:TPA: hypothetical protein ACJG25_004154 [Salmonella enterica subsp. enterica serovar Saintpaul]